MHSRIDPKAKADMAKIEKKRLRIESVGETEFEILKFDSPQDMINELGLEEMMRLAYYAYYLETASKARDRFIEEHKDHKAVRHEERKRYMRNYMRKVRAGMK